MFTKDNTSPENVPPSGLKLIVNKRCKAESRSRLNWNLKQLLSYYATENNVYISEMLQMQSAEPLRSNQSTYNNNNSRTVHHFRLKTSSLKSHEMFEWIAETSSSVSRYLPKIARLPKRASLWAKTHSK